MHYTLRGKISKAHPYQLDPTLSVYGAGAEAEATGLAIKEAKDLAENHNANQENPHNVTKTQVGLGNVDNTADTEKPVSKLQAEAIENAKQAGLDAQVAAENAQTAADNAQTAADNAQTAADNAQTSADEAKTAVEESRRYTDSKHLTFTAKLSTEWTATIASVEKTDEETGEVWRTEQETAPYTQEVILEGTQEEVEEEGSEEEGEEETVYEDGILATDHPHVMPVYSEDFETALLEKEAWAMVSKATTEDGKIIFTCFEDKPVTEITLQIEVNR